MYTAFFGLREKPFPLSPDPRYLFLSQSHREALAHLLKTLLAVRTEYQRFCQFHFVCLIQIL